MKHRKDEAVHDPHSALMARAQKMGIKQEQTERVPPSEEYEDDFEVLVNNLAIEEYKKEET